MRGRRRKKHDCGCSGHPSGRPKVSRGPCYGYGDVRPAVIERRRGRRIARVWITAFNVDDVED